MTDTDTPAPPVAAIPEEAVEEAASEIHRVIRESLDPDERDQFIRFWTPRKGVGDPVIMHCYAIAYAALTASLPHLCPATPTPGPVPVVTDEFNDLVDEYGLVEWAKGARPDDPLNREEAIHYSGLIKDMYAALAATPPPPPAPLLDEFSVWLDTLTYDVAEGRNRISAAEAVAAFRASRATEGDGR